jgi:tetratricopeptide (TPR) repeat protein
MNRMAAFASIATLLLSISAGSPARAQETRAQTVQRLSEDGTTLYQAREYRRAIDKFNQAYAIEPDPNLLYNIAKCHEALGEKDAAIAKYEQFISAPGADSQGRVRAQETVRVLKASRAEPPTSPERRDAQATPAASQPPYGTIGWVTLAGGVVIGAIGTVVYVLGASDHSKITSATNYNNPGQVVALTEQRANDLRDSGTTKKTVGAVLWGVGGAALALSAVFFVLQSNNSERSVAFGVAPGPGGGAATLTGRF